MSRNSQIFNPYLPSYEYIPDGEPHVFDGKLYIFGSHDRFNGDNFCLNDYICYSADISDLTKWRYEGVIYRKAQDPRNQNISGCSDGQKPEGVTCSGTLDAQGMHAMYAPDVVRGADGKYYLYYCLDCLPEIAVAVCDKPDGEYQFLGFVRHPDRTPLGKKEGDLYQFDPAIMIDDDGTVYLYSGLAPIRRGLKRGNKGSQVMILEQDMLTLKSAPKRLLPDVYESRGTGFEGHEFYEASSIRKINGKYYFIYSSIQSHELSYAVSDKPDEGYRFGGTLVDIGDIFLNGRTKKQSVNCLGNTHGGIECVNGQWYVFYHRQTNRTNFSRQGCAEKISIDTDGIIRQAEVTSCGLNAGPLLGKGVYPANICCHLTGKNGAIMSLPMLMKMKYPYLTQDIPDVEPDQKEASAEAGMPIQYIKNIKNGSVIGYKYFDIQHNKGLKLTLRGNAKGIFTVFTSLTGESCGKIPFKLNSDVWKIISGNVKIPSGVHSIYLRFEGTGTLDFIEMELL